MRGRYVVQPCDNLGTVEGLERDRTWLVVLKSEGDEEVVAELSTRAAAYTYKQEREREAAAQPPRAWSALLPSLLEALRGGPYAPDTAAAGERFQAAKDILETLMGELDDINAEAHEAYQENGALIPSEVAGEALLRFLTTDEMIRRAADQDS